MKNMKILICAVAIGVMLISQLTSPLWVYADGETPVPTDQPTEVVATETPTPDPLVTDSPAASPSPTEAAVETDTPLPATDTPTDVATPTLDLSSATSLPVDTNTPAPTDAADASIPSTPALVDTSTPASTDAAVTDAAPTDTPAQDTTTPLLAQVPDNTQVVVTDSDGQSLTLASQAAADVIATSDPIWCPDGVAPIANIGGCTGSYSTMNALLSSESSYIDSQIVSGTIWIASGAVADVSTIAIDGQGYVNWSQHALTLQGGWSGISGDTTIFANSVFSVPIYNIFWNNNITVNNITVNGATGTGLTINTTGNVTINNSTFSNNTGDGAYVSANNVTIDNSTFSNNSNGLLLYASGSQSPSLAINHSTIQNNTSVGLSTNGFGSITLNCVVNQNNNQNESFTNSAAPVYIPCPTSTTTPTTTPTSTVTATSTAAPTSTTVPSSTEDPASTAVPTSIEVSLPASQVVTVSSDQDNIEVPLNCHQASNFLVVWPTGDKILITCVPDTDTSARITRINNTTLTPDLPAGYEYVTAYKVEVFQNGVSIPVLPAGGFIQPMFGSRHENPQYRMMAWDEKNNKWTLLNEYQKDQNGASVIFPFDPSNPQDGRKILQGTRYITTDNPDHEDIKTNFATIFVLVQQ